uniref:RanBP2-type domain-containing protein n=1 Tax=Hordeum vulgare subsp. vulgare TaxID=112509 RepID=A0A8I6XG26_HORVV
MFVPKIDNQSELEGPHRNAGPWLCSICSQKNDTSCISCEVCGVLWDLSLYFSNANEAEGGEKSTQVYLYWQDLFSHHLVQNQKLLSSLMDFKATEMQPDTCKLPWVLCTRHTWHIISAVT